MYFDHIPSSQILPASLPTQLHTSSLEAPSQLEGQLTPPVCSGKEGQSVSARERGMTLTAGVCLAPHPRRSQSQPSLPSRGRAQRKHLECVLSGSYSCKVVFSVREWHDLALDQDHHCVDSPISEAVHGSSCWGVRCDPSRNLLLWSNLSPT